MELLYPYFLTAIVLGLVYLLWQKDENNYYDRESWREERADLLEQAERERKDLYDRLMAGTLPQYKEQADNPNDIEDTEDNEEISDLDEAKDEITGDAQPE